MTLTWRKNNEWDINGYVIYTGTTTGFDAGEESELVVVPHPIRSTLFQVSLMVRPITFLSLRGTPRGLRVRLPPSSLESQ